ncbi:MAG: tetratricopeptide repeat protein [Bryobacteraceae bacterium]
MIPIAMVIIFLFLSLVLPAVAAAQTEQYVNRGYARAVQSLRLAQTGDPVAQYDFALMCERGEGIPQNHTEAVRWFRLSAARDYAPAQLFLGLMYASGKGVAQDYRLALLWLHLAAEQDDQTAQFYLGGLYFSSTALPQDYTQAYKWFTLAGRHDASRPKMLEPLAEKMTADQLMDAQSQIRHWNPRRPR